MTTLHSANLKQPWEIFNAILSRTNEILMEEYERGPVQSRQVRALIRVMSEVLVGEQMTGRCESAVQMEKEMKLIALETRLEAAEEKLESLLQHLSALANLAGSCLEHLGGRMSRVEDFIENLQLDSLDGEDE